MNRGDVISGEEDNVFNYDVVVRIHQSPLSTDKWSIIGSLLRGIIEGLTLELSLDLSALSGVVITDDLISDVKTFQAEKGEVVEITDDPEYICVAKNVYYMDPRRGRVTKLFFQANLILTLVDIDAPGLATARALNRRSPALAFILHELAHIHDDAAIHRQFGYSNTEINLGDSPNNIATSVSRLIWSEYHAEHIARSIFREEKSEMDLRTLVTIHNQIVRRVTEMHDEYQATGNVVNLWRMIVEHTSSYLNQMGRVVPSLAVYPAERKRALIGLLGPFGSILTSMEEELKRLLLDFNKWEYWTWSNLNDIVWLAWEKCGAIPQWADGHGLFLNITDLQPDFKEINDAPGSDHAATGE